MSLRSMVDRAAGECIAVRLRLLHRLVCGVYDDALRPFGVRVAQMNVLTAVAKLGPTTPTAIARKLVLEKSSFSRDVATLKREGWVVAEDSEDGRSHLLRITPAGLRLLVRIAPAWEQAQAEAKKILGEAGVAALKDAVDGVWREQNAAAD